MKKVDNLKRFPVHVEMDYNPNLIKALNDPLATLGFTLGQPASQSCWQRKGGALVITCSHVSSPKTKTQGSLNCAAAQVFSFPQLLTLNKAPNFLIAKMPSQGLWTM